MNEKGTVFFPDKTIIETPQDYGLEYEDIYFKSTDNVKLNGWWIPHNEAIATLLWFHGNAGNIGDRSHNIFLMHSKLPINIFIFDYREYGRSDGTISRQGTFMDSEGAYKYLIEIRKVPEEELILFGRSLGSALATFIASRFKCTGLILEAAFTSSTDIMKLYGIPASFISRNANLYKPIEWIREIKVPVLYIHGEFDYTIPSWMSRTMYENTHHPKFYYMVHGAGHNDTYIAGGDKYFARIGEFINFCLSYRNS